MNTPQMAFIAVGSNLGDRRALIASAIVGLDRHEAMEVKGVSSIIETAPMGRPGQGPYLNAVIALETTLGPHELLRACQQIEAAHGRNRSAEQRWGPRRLDLDILLYGDTIIDEPDLTVPHPRMHERSFVLDPLAAIAPDLRHPVLRRSIAELRDALRTGGGEAEIEVARLAQPKPRRADRASRR
jgi:2-amino-4-hydroxy-6-hydroxymethyldihydropteridine diphosphokinase